MIRNSLEALAFSILTECQKSESDKKHSAIKVSYSANRLRNGLGHCSVEVTCEAKCGWLIDTYGTEAHELQQKASGIKKLLANADNVEMVFDILNREFPALIMQVKV